MNEFCALWALNCRVVEAKLGSCKEWNQNTDDACIPVNQLVLRGTDLLFGLCPSGSRAKTSQNVQSALPAPVR
eukprot:6247127-Prymnesium_polylepis.1